MGNPSEGYPVLRAALSNHPPRATQKPKGCLRAPEPPLRSHPEKGLRDSWVAYSQFPTMRRVAPPEPPRPVRGVELKILSRTQGLALRCAGAQLLRAGAA